jgi:hypothetical protein
MMSTFDPHVFCCQSFSDAYHLVESTVPLDETGAPYVLKNETGMFISVKPGAAFQVSV